MDRRAFLSCPLALAASGATAQDKATLRSSTATGPAFALGKAGERWTALLNEGSGGAFEVAFAPGATLSARDPLREFGALRDGAIDLAVGSALAWSSQLAAFGVYGLPWMAPEQREQEALASAAAVRQRVDAAAAAAGVVIVAVEPLGERVVATFDAGVTASADLAGKRIRTLTIPLVMDTLATLGARPEAMPLADARVALASRTLHGQEGPASTLAAARFAAAGLAYVTRWGAFADVMMFAVRASVWATWSQGQRDTAQAAALQAAREAATLEREDAALAELRKQGVTLVLPAAAQRAAFRAAVEPVWTKWSAPIGTALVAEAQSAVGK